MLDSQASMIIKLKTTVPAELIIHSLQLTTRIFSLKLQVSIFIFKTNIYLLLIIGYIPIYKKKFIFKIINCNFILKTRIYIFKIIGCILIFITRIYIFKIIDCILIFKTEYIPDQLMCILKSMLHVKLKYVFTRFVQIYIILVKL